MFVRQKLKASNLSFGFSRDELREPSEGQSFPVCKKSYALDDGYFKKLATEDCLQRLVL